MIAMIEAAAAKMPLRRDLGRLMVRRLDSGIVLPICATYGGLHLHCQHRLDVLTRDMSQASSPTG
jgi:hypothetical protein